MSFRVEKPANLYERSLRFNDLDQEKTLSKLSFSPDQDDEKNAKNFR